MCPVIQNRGVFEVIVIGGGIMGIAIAAVEAERGRRVLLLEREERPFVASVESLALLLALVLHAHLGHRSV